MKTSAESWQKDGTLFVNYDIHLYPLGHRELIETINSKVVRRRLIP
jgi:hypothetical protein